MNYTLAKTHRKKELAISLPENYDMGYLPINQETTIDFLIENPHNRPLPYLWKFTVFKVSPASGVLLAQTRNRFQVSFSPKEATVVVGTIIFEAEGQEPRIIKLSAIGKYAYVSSNTSEVDFQGLLVGKLISKQIVLRNSSPVPAQFNIDQNAIVKQGGFSLNPLQGLIPAKSSFEVKVNYCPQIANIVNRARLAIKCEGGNDIKVDLAGFATPFDVKLHPRSLNFGQVKLDNVVSRPLTLTNNSDLDTSYQFFTDSGNIFTFSEPKGVIARNSYKRIIVQFHPHNTINYYSRVYCVVRNHQLLYVDLLGTCYDLLMKPIPLLQVHVDLFRRRVIEGRLSEIDLKYLENNVLMKINRRLEMLRDDSTKNLSSEEFNMPELAFKENELALHKELFLEGTQHPLIGISDDYIDFGFCDCMTVSGAREIEITNKLSCKLTIFWISQKRENFNGDYMTVFQVYPESATIKANSTVKFQITFRPLKTNYYFFQELQFFAVKDTNPKVTKKTLEEIEKREMKTLKPQVTLLKTLKVTQTIQNKVKDELEHAELLPPVCGVVRCVGHSFGPTSMSFIPIVEVRPSKSVIFPASRINQSVYQTVELVNLSDTPSYYKVSSDAKLFKVFPKAGLIEGKGFQILVFEFTPRQYKTYRSSIMISLNNSSASPLMISVQGICSEPKLRIQNQGKIYFPPTFTGVYFKQNLEIQNLSKLPVTYYVDIPEKYMEEIFVNPVTKQLQPNQNFQLELCFIPHQKKLYKIKLPLIVKEIPVGAGAEIGYYSPGSGSESANANIPQLKEANYNLQIFGEGSDGSLQLQSERVDFQVVKVSEQKKLKVKLRNVSNCNFYVQITLKNTDPDSPVTQQHINSSFHLQFSEGIIAANSEMLIGITFTPVEVMRFDLQMVVSAKQKAPKGNKSTPRNISIAKCSLQILAHGSFPLLKIVDIRNDSISVAALWQNFQISKINQELSQNLNGEEKKYLNIENLPFVEAQALQNKLKSFEWNFGYVSSKNNFRARKIIITVKNFGGTNLEYNFKLPSDNSIEEEIWADPGEPSKEEAYQKAILAKNIFQIHPKSDSLKPNDVRDIELIYTPANILTSKDQTNEKHYLTVVLEIKNGKPLVLNLKGMTLGPYEGLLAIKKNNYRLPDTPIGLLIPLKFPIEIQNVGSSKINYKASIEYADKQFPEVFTISNPNNSLLPSQKHYLYCLFKPLEKKKYNFKLNIQVFDFVKLTQTVDITLQGEGYEKPPKNKKQVKSIQDIPGQRSLVSEIGSKVFFSIQQIDFGTLKSGQTTHRMIILYNLSKTSALSFEFPTQSQASLKKPGLTCGDNFLIEPSSGEIPPSSFVELKITLTALKTPSVYEGEIECNIIWGYKFDPKDKLAHTDISQKSADLNFEKETLFLRIKKNSCFEPLLSLDNDIKTSEKNSVFETVFTSILSSSLNDKSLLQDIQKLYDIPFGVVDMLPQDEPASISKQPLGIDRMIMPQSNINHSNHRYFFLNDEFLDMSNLIMENTFFNIIQETTHKQNDLLRIAKKFVSATRD